MHLLVLSSVACLSHAFKSGDHEGPWVTQAQLTRREIVETSMSWAGSDTGRLVAAFSEEVSQHVCVSGFGVGQSIVIVYVSVSVSAVRECACGGMCLYLSMASVYWTSLCEQ